MGARVYDPTLRRWLSPDPLLLAAPQVDAVGAELNLYAYTGNNPVIYTDPNGTCRFEDLKGDCTTGINNAQKIIADFSGDSWSEGNYGVSIAGYAVTALATGYVILGAVAQEPVDIWNSAVDATNGNYQSAAKTAVVSAVTILPVGKIGRFVMRNRSMSLRAAQFQSQITGKAENVDFNLNGVDFDGFVDDVLLEAKGPGYAGFVDKASGKFHDWFKGAEGLVDQAKRQVSAANGAKIEWHVAEDKAASAIRKLFKDNEIKGIDVKYIEPMK